MSEFFSGDPSLVFNGLFCSYGSGSVFSLRSPWSVFISEMGTELLLWEPGQLLPLLGLAQVLGPGRKAAALMVSEGEPWELSLTSATHRVLPQVSPGMRFAEAPWAPLEVPHCSCR